MARKPGLVRTQEMKVQIECEGSVTVGAVIADLRTNPSEGNEISVCVEVDADRVVYELLSVF